eukprot:TRINITY_DN12260_c0_g4_i1.p1 TRINITY_DN12260_c0_g4~~TRINITY_DN12260_c0_g4_i1.p1  ORF type:complete len:230 (-),score=39.15 TRINITY_DN12260_c0_g4_i1:210-845(-)
MEACQQADTDLSAPVVGKSSLALEGASPRCKAFLQWVMERGIEVVVFDMDHTMSACHCGSGLPRGELDSYTGAASSDFVEAARALCRIPGMKLAVATGSDPVEYDVPGFSRETHILGPDLATALIQRWCPEVLPSFEVMVGFDPRLHEEVPLYPGKTVHMRRIAEHYGGMSASRMVLIDDIQSCLMNDDGWHGVLVRDRSVGFRFEDCLST